MSTPKQTIMKALQQYRGDDLYRARIAWGALTAAELDEEYGDSGATRREILRSLEEHDREVQDAIEWLVEKEQ